MEQVSEKLTSYASSRARRSLVDDSDCAGSDDKEYATSGFYVREKSNDKQSRSNSSSNSNDATENDKEEEKSNADNVNLVNGEASGEIELAETEKKHEEESDDSEKKDETEVTQEGDKTGTEDVVEEGNEAEIEEKSEAEVNEEGNDKDESDKNEIEAEPEEKLEETSNEIDKNKPEEKEVENTETVEAGEKTVTNNVSSTDEEATAKVINEEESAVETEKIEEAKEQEESKASEDKEGEPMPLDDKKEDEPVSLDDKIENEPVSLDDKKENEPVSLDDKKEDEPVSLDDKKEDEPVSLDNKKEDEPVSLDDKKEDDPMPLDDKKDEVEPMKESEDKKKEAEPAKEGQPDQGKKREESLSKHSSSTNTGTDYEDEDDFDPSLLCPDISMDIEEAPVLTNSQPPPTTREGSVSPLPYEPIFSTLVDEYTGTEIQVDLTPEEMELRQNMYKPSNPVQSTKIHCTACNVHLGSALTGANNRFVHPLLKVLICKNCYHFYTSGEFEKDEDGSELYCRWCGQGGQVLCCSSCEFVFCKRCIRNNFGPKKFKQIRESDDWNCFRCEPGQLSYLRAACAEFIDYYKKESLRVHGALAASNPELMNTDYTKCCSKEKVEDGKPTVQRAKRRRNNNEDSDPDYVHDGGEPSSKRQALCSTGAPSTSNQLRPLAPKLGAATPIVAPIPSKTAIRPQVALRTENRPVGNNAIRRNVPPGFVPRPGPSATPGYVKMMSQPRQPRPMAPNQQVRPSSSFTVISGATTNGRPTFTSVRATKPVSQMPPMKHEWFEKTVRAAARVNSNLSYTLTQLNRQQSQATSVESLAVVHNKLQEVLSTSINSLIQVRKNLRTEFLVGIKSVKLPPKTLKPTAAPLPAPAAAADDDDVIFVSQPPPLIMSPSITVINNNKKIVPKVAVNNSFNNNKTKPIVTPKPSVPKASASTSGAKITPTISKNLPTASIGGPVKGGGFLKVRSLMALQSVPSECITIPDDPVEDPLKLTVQPEPDQIEILDDESEKDEPPPKSIGSPPPLADLSPSSPVLDVKMTYNVHETPSPEVRKMMKAHVPLVKSASLEQLLEKDKLSHNEEDEKPKGRRNS